jgi:hypothetical protein
MARLAGRWRLQPIWWSTRQTWPGWYFTPVTVSITSATRASVHNSVGNRLALGPFSNARSTLARSDELTLGGRPGWPVRFRACLPPAFHFSCQSDTVWWETSSSRPMSAWETPLANRSAARIRRASMAAKSLRGRALDGGLVTLVPAGLGEGVGIHQLFHSIRHQRSIMRRSLAVGNDQAELVVFWIAHDCDCPPARQVLVQGTSPATESFDATSCFFEIIDPQVEVEARLLALAIRHRLKIQNRATSDERSYAVPTWTIRPSGLSSSAKQFRPECRY